MLRETLRLGRLYLFSPAKGAEAARKEGSFIPSLWLYLAFTAGYMLFFWLKPWDFPDQNAPFPRETLGLFFWFKVMLWQPPLEIAWILFLMGLVAWLRGGSLPMRLAAGVLWTASPFILIACYAQNTIPRWAFAAGSLAWTALFYPCWRKVPREEWMPVASFMLGINVIGLALIIPMAVSALIKQADLFTFVQIAGGLWILGAGTLGLRALTGLRLPRAFMSVLLSMFFQIALAFTLHLLGLVPKEILKALLYA